MGDVAYSMSKIYVALYNQQENHQASMIQMEGNICDKIISILIDPSSNYIHLSLMLVERCQLNQEPHEEYWLVQLATRIKMRIWYWVKV